MTPIDPSRLLRLLLIGLSIGGTSPSALANDVALPEPSVEAEMAHLDEPAPSPREWIHGKPWWTWSRATGDWNGHRRRLSDHGLAVRSGWTIDTTKVESGGARRNTTTRSLFRLGADWNLEPLLALSGTSVHATFQVQAGRNASESVGDFQSFSNVDAENRQQLAEFWLEQSFGDDRVRVRAGKFDANREFASVESAGTFLNSSMGYTPTILSFPSYPDPALGASVTARAGDRLEFALGVFDGALQEGIPTGKRGARTALGPPSDWIALSEARLNWHLCPLRPGRLALGGWHHSGHFSDYGGGRTSGTEGGYLVVEQTLWSQDSRRLALFAQLGFADESVSPIGRHVGGGLSWMGPFSGRSADELGLGITTVEFSDRTAAGFVEDHETAYEVFYRISITPWLAVQPDVQFITDPGGDGTSDVTVATLRVQLEF